jgi:hypothetical protein
MSGGGDVGGWTPLQCSVAKAWEELEGSRKINAEKQRVGKRGSAGQIPSPFIHSHDIWMMMCTTLGVRTPRAHHPDTDRGPGATSLSGSVKQFRKQEVMALHECHTHCAVVTWVRELLQ